VQDMARDTTNLIDALHLRDVTVVGWSMGGAVVQQLAIDAPSSVRSIVLMNTVAPGQAGTPVTPAVMSTLSGKSGADLRDVMAVLFPADAVKSAVDCFEKDMFRPADYHASTVSDTVDAGQAALLDTWSHDQQAVTALRSVKMPVLVLGGANDEVLAASNAQALGTLLPNARVVTVGNAGHAMMYQYPHALASEISAFAQR
jgi:pimeloyl-ACP methyl ester carboxylesterase